MDRPLLILLGSVAGLGIAGGFLIFTRPGDGPTPPPAFAPPSTPLAAPAPAVPAPRTFPPPSPTAPGKIPASITAALAESDPEKQLATLRAALSEWAGRHPIAALEWAQRQNQTWRPDALDAVLTAAEPALILPRALELFAAEPAFTSSLGGNVVSAFVARDQFSAALSLVRAAPADLRENWATAVFLRWGAAQPAAALAGLPQLPDDDQTRHAARRALVEGWASANPATLAAYAVTLPAGPSKDHALNAALTNWSLQDPAALSVWLGNAPPGPAFDQAAAALVLRADRLNRTPDVALGWAATIADPALRLQALTHALRELAQQDSAAAQRYIAQSPLLTAPQREDLGRSLAVP